MSSEKGCDQAFDNMTEEPSAPLEISKQKSGSKNNQKTNLSGVREQEDTKL